MIFDVRQVFVIWQEWQIFSCEGEVIGPFLCFLNLFDLNLCEQRKKYSSRFSEVMQDLLLIVLFADDRGWPSKWKSIKAPRSVWEVWKNPWRQLVNSSWVKDWEHVPTTQWPTKSIVMAKCTDPSILALLYNQQALKLRRRRVS